MSEKDFLNSQYNVWFKTELDAIDYFNNNHNNLSDWDISRISSTLWDCSKMLALYEYFIQNDYRKTKMLFYRCGRLMEFSSKKCDVFPTYNGLQQLAYNMLSDNSKLIQNLKNV